MHDAPAVQTLRRRQTRSHGASLPVEGTGNKEVDASKELENSVA